MPGSWAPLVRRLSTASTPCLAVRHSVPVWCRCKTGGVAIEVEVWRMPVEHFGSFVAGIPAPLGIGKVKLEDGSVVSGFLCETLGVAGAADISSLGGWRQYLATRR